MFGVIAKVMQVDVDTLSEDTYLREFGVDSLSSLEIASELTRTVRIDSLTGYMLFGAVSIGDVVKHLRFATLPVLPSWVLVSRAIMLCTTRPWAENSTVQCRRGQILLFRSSQPFFAGRFRSWRPFILETF